VGDAFPLRVRNQLWGPLEQMPQAVSVTSIHRSTLPRDRHASLPSDVYIYNTKDAKDAVRLRFYGTPAEAAYRKLCIYDLTTCILLLPRVQVTNFFLINLICSYSL
jgi:hypothetical protein